MARFRSRPSEVEAVQWTGDDDSLDLVSEFTEGKVRTAGQAPPAERSRVRHHLELLAGKNGEQGWVPVPRGYWIVRQPGDLTDHWPVEDDYFQTKYERIEDA